MLWSEGYLNVIRLDPNRRGGKQMATISVVIPTFHRYEALGNVVADLLRQTVPPKQIIVVDNTRRPDRKQPSYLVSTRETEVLYISSSGEARVNVARNEGLKAVTADYVIVFDDDMELPDDCVEKFLEVHAEGWDAVTGAVVEDTVMLEHQRNGERPLWSVLLHWHGNNQGHTIAVPSGFVSMRASMIRELGLLDEAFVYNYDDYDLGYRIWSGGFTLIHDPRPTCHHLKLQVGGSRKELTGARRSLNKYTAKYYFLAKHFSRQAVVLEFLSDVLLSAWDFKWNIPRAVKELTLVTSGFRGSINYARATDR